MKLRSLRTQRGDTIVEVLIVVAILSLILVGSFAVSNRSTRGTIQSQERSEAAKGTESQMELLKSYLSQTATPAGLPATGEKFCMKADGKPTGKITGTIPNDPQSDNFQAFETQPEIKNNCKVNEFTYQYIERQGNTYTAHTRWNNIGSGGIDEATMVHRLYPDVAAGGQGTPNNTGCPLNYGLNVLAGCTPCPNGFASPGGFVPIESCQPILPKIIVTVKKIPPAAGNNTPSCSAAATENRAGLSVGLSRSGFSQTATTNGSSEATFSSLSYNPNYTYSATVNPPNKYRVCPPTSKQVTTQGLGNAPGVGTTARIDLVIRPECEVQTTNNWVLEPVPSSYYADIIGYNSYWAQGTRAGHPGYPGGYTDGWFGNMGSTAIIGGYGYNYWFGWDGRTRSDGALWYNVWLAVWVNDPIWGAPYYHQNQWVNHPTSTNVCP